MIAVNPRHSGHFPPLRDGKLVTGIESRHQGAAAHFDTPGFIELKIDNSEGTEPQPVDLQVELGAHDPRRHAQAAAATQAAGIKGSGSTAAELGLLDDVDDGSGSGLASDSEGSKTTFDAVEAAPDHDHSGNRGQVGADGAGAVGADGQIIRPPKLVISASGKTGVSLFCSAQRASAPDQPLF